MKRRPIQFAALAVLWALGSGLAAAGSDVNPAALELPAAQGDPGALTELGVRYEHAEGVPGSFDKARALFCSAAKQGDAEAQFQLGWLYANGRGVPHDDGVAAALFTLAAQQGHEYAARLLRYVHPQPDARLPSCVAPDPPAEEAKEDAVPVPRERADIVGLVYQLAPRYRVDPKLALAVISAESGFDEAAVSSKNAQGLMQLMPQTALRFGVTSPLNPVENIRGGLAYLRWLLAYFQGNVALVLAAYNAGERAVEQYRGIPPYAETRDYVRKITGAYGKARHPFEAGVVEPSPIMVRGDSR